MIKLTTNVCIAIGMVLLPFVGAASLFVPYQIAPYSFVLLIPGFALSDSNFVLFGVATGGLVAPIFFFLFTRHVIKSNLTLPKLSTISFCVISLLSIIWACYGWDSTVRYTSIYRAIALVTQAILPIFIISLLAYKQRKTLTINKSLLLHWFAFAWFCWGAFPWYGELL